MRALATGNTLEKRRRKETTIEHGQPKNALGPGRATRIYGGWAAILILASLPLCLALAPLPAGAASGGPASQANMAFNDPDQFAWRLFAAVNRPGPGGLPGRPLGNLG